MTEVTFIRHGQTEWNTEKREMGHLDSPLTKKGEKQAAALAERLKGHKFSALYSSDLGRALHTAQYISTAVNLPIITDEELRERNMGIFQGHTRKEMAKLYPFEWKQYNSEDKFDYIIPQGESQRQRYERSIRVFNRLADQHPKEKIVMVSHGGILRGIFEYVLNIAPGNEDSFKRRNATLNRFIKNGSQWSLDVWGDTSHLGSELI